MGIRSRRIIEFTARYRTLKFPRAAPIGLSARYSLFPFNRRTPALSLCRVLRLSLASSRPTLATLTCRRQWSNNRATISKLLHTISIPVDRSIDSRRAISCCALIDRPSPIEHNRGIVAWTRWSPKLLPINWRCKWPETSTKGQGSASNVWWRTQTCGSITELILIRVATRILSYVSLLAPLDRL